MGGRVLSAWAKFISDLSRTTVQITYFMVIFYGLIVWKGIRLATTVADVIALLNAILPGLLIVLGHYFGRTALEVWRTTRQ